MTDIAPAYDEDREEAPEEEAGGFDLASAAQSPNLAFDLDDTTLGRMGSKVCEEFKIDLESREEAGYEERVKRALKLASLAKEAKNTPWENASNVKYPLVIQAAIQFNARSYPAIIDGPNVAKVRVQGKPSPEKHERAKRVGEHMSYQLLEEQEEWEDDTDQMLLRLAVVGTLVRKTFFNPELGRNCSVILGPDEFVVSYDAKRDLSVVPRQTHVLRFYPHEITEKMRAGLWLDVELGQPAQAANDDQAPHEFLEQHRLWDLDEDGYPEPYIITVHRETEKVVRVQARWRKGAVQVNSKGEVVKIKPYRCFTKYGFIPNPDGGFYDVGYGTLLGPLTDTVNTTINQLIDAGALSNLQGGFIGDGVSIKSGNQRFKPGEWKKAQSSGASLRENIVPLPTKEPSTVLFNLMTFLIEAARDLTSTQEILTGDAGKSTMPVGTTLALIEQGMKAFTAIVKRTLRSLKDELRINFDLNATYLNPEVYFTFQDEERVTGLQDYAEGDLDVVPVADPNMATDMQKMGRAQFLLSLAGPDVNVTEIKKYAMETAGIPDPARFLPQGPPPPDPKVEIENRKLDLEEQKIRISDNKLSADMAEQEARIAKTVAEAMNTQMQTMLAAPQFQLAVVQAIQMGREALTSGDDTGSPDAPSGAEPVQPGNVPGMEGPPADAAVPSVPEGPQGEPDGAVGLGPGIEPEAPDQGAAVPGAF